MIYFHQSGKDAIAKACAGAAKGIVCTPYYTEPGLQLLDAFFDSAEDVEFWTRFNPLDWKAGVADMAALRRRVQSVMRRDKAFEIRVSDDLHAKIYSFSNGTVIVGSANLTWPAMTSNIEVICELTGTEAASFLHDLPVYRNRLTPVPIDVFAAYVDAVKDVVSKPFDGPAEEDKDMNAAIDLAEERLRKALTQTSPKPSSIPLLEIEAFYEYCQGEGTSVSREVMEQVKGKYNLQGHMKHCYYGAVRFFHEFPQYVDEIASTPSDSLYDFAPICEQWRDFLHRHGDEIDDTRDFSFHTLRLYLPPTLGGSRIGGGGASPTLKRVFPVVARMLRAQKR
jgi:hypothetical protein